MRGDLKLETEGLITAAQDEALRTNVIKSKIKKQQLSPLCRMCGVKDETVGHLPGHLLCECRKMAQMQYISTGMATLPGLCTGQSRNSMDLMSQRNGMSTSQNQLSKLLP